MAIDSSVNYIPTSVEKTKSGSNTLVFANGLKDIKSH